MPHLQPEPPTSLYLRKNWAPLIDVVIEAFGPDQCMFESNFSVDKQSCTYASLWNAFMSHTADYAPAERTALFRGTAAGVYRLNLDNSMQG